MMLSLKITTKKFKKPASIFPRLIVKHTHKTGDKKASDVKNCSMSQSYASSILHKDSTSLEKFDHISK